MRCRFIISTLLLATGFLLLTTGRARAYIDPGTGSYILQLILAGMVGAAFTLKLFWKRIKLFVLVNVLKRDGRTEDQSADEDG